MSQKAFSQCLVLADSMVDIASWFENGRDWPLLAPTPRADWLTLLSKSREHICASLGECNRDEVENLLRSKFFQQPDVATRTGLVFERSTAGQSRVESAREIMAAGWTHPMATHAFVVAALDAQPWELPVMRDLQACSENAIESYLRWLFIRPAFREPGDDTRYVSWLAGMLDWLRDVIGDPQQHSRFSLIANAIVGNLDLGMIIYSDVSIRPVLDARARLLDTLASQIETLRGSGPGPTATRPRGGRIRLGILLRNILRSPDPLTFCSQFEYFDPERYEIIIYSRDLIDRQCEHDISLYQRLFRFVSSVRSLNSLSVRETADRIHSDDLDIFIYSSAATIGASTVDLLARLRLGRIQILMNSFVPMSTGFESFTHLATVKPAPESEATLLSECREKFVEIPEVLLSYPPFVPQPPVRQINRNALRIPADAVVLYNGGAADKIVPALMEAWVRALSRIPGSYLLLAPFNPGWSGARAAVNLNGLINSTCRRLGVDARRVVVLRELSPRDTHQLYELSTLYLGTFPHGSSTSVALAMQAAVPAVTRRSPWLRGTGDASIVQSIGLDELVAADADAYVELTVRLAQDTEWRAAIRQKILDALPGAPFLSSRRYGEALQGVFDKLTEEIFT